MKINELSEDTIEIVRRLVESGCIEMKDDEVDITNEMAKPVDKVRRIRYNFYGILNYSS